MTATARNHSNSPGHLRSSSRRAREAIADTPYLWSLPPREREWMLLFLRAGYATDEWAARALVETEEDKVPVLYSASVHERDRQARDLMSAGFQVPWTAVEPEENSSVLFSPCIREENDAAQCSHCYRRKCRCKGKRQRFSRYSPLDYQNR